MSKTDREELKSKFQPDRTPQKRRCRKHDTMKTSKIETLGVLDTEVSNLAAHAKSIDYLTGEVFGDSKFGKELSSIKSSIRNYILKYQDEREKLVEILPKDMEVIYIGHYKPYMNSDGSMVVDAVALTYDQIDPQQSNIINCRLIACGDDVEKIMKLNAFDIIAGEFYYNPLTFRNGNRFEISTGKSTSFWPRNWIDDYAPNHEEKIETILGAYPIIPLAEMGNNLSRQVNNKDKQYTDTLDLRHLKCVIASYEESDGYSGDAVLTVTDSSITVSDNTRPIRVRTTSDIPQKAGTGKGSFVHMLGYVSRNNAGFVEFIACAIMPIKAVPFTSDVVKKSARKVKSSTSKKYKTQNQIPVR